MLTFSIDLAVKTSRPHNIKETRQSARLNYTIFRITDGFQPAMIHYVFSRSLMNLTHSLMASCDNLLYLIPPKHFLFVNRLSLSLRQQKIE